MSMSSRFFQDRLGGGFGMQRRGAVWVRLHQNHQRMVKFDDLKNLIDK